MGKKNRRSRQDRDSWLQAGLDALYEDGIDRVKIEVLARRLGVTKGSFYWHFEDREALLRTMIDFWKATQMGHVRRLSDASYTDAAARLTALMEFVLSKDSRHDIGIRAWALVHRQAASAVRAVDRKRLTYVESVFVALGFDAFESKLRARTLYFYQVGEHTSTIRDGTALRKKLAKQRFDWFVGSSP